MYRSFHIWPLNPRTVQITSSIKLAYTSEQYGTIANTSKHERGDFKSKNKYTNAICIYLHIGKIKLSWDDMTQYDDNRGHSLYIPLEKV